MGHIRVQLIKRVNEAGLIKKKKWSTLGSVVSRGVIVISVNMVTFNSVTEMLHLNPSECLFHTMHS